MFGNLSILDVPLVDAAGLREWQKLLQDDATREGGTASTLLRLQPDDMPVEVTCCSQVTIVRQLTELEFLIKCATVFIADQPMNHIAEFTRKQD